MAGAHSRLTLLRLTVCCLLFVLVTVASSGPVKRPKNKLLTCSRHCRVPKPSKFRYETGQVYDYSYKVEMSTYMSSAPHRSVKLLLEALASVHVLGTCDMLLKLREVRLMEFDLDGNLRKADDSKDFRQEAEKGVLRFAFLDGRVSDVCPSKDESPWALNVKRGFLSAFQTNMENFNKDQTVDETDVLGTCRTVYHTSGTTWFSNTIKKSRDLSNCSNPHPPSSFPHHLPHGESTVFQTFLSGRQDCQQTVNWNGFLLSALCVEQRHFRPLAGETTGSVTKVSQMVKFLQKRERRKFFPPIHKRMALAYDYAAHESANDNDNDDDMETEEAIRKIRVVLRQMCSSAEIVPETPDLFYDLVANVRQLKGHSLRVLYEKVSGESLCGDYLRVKKYFLDSLAMAGTEPAVRLLVKALTSRSREPISSHFLLTTLPFLPSITTPILQAVRPLLDAGPTSEEALLPVSAMLHRYCQQHNCDTDTDVQRIMLYFRRAVGAQCYAKGSHMRKVVLGLRAIGNAGQAKRMTEILDACLKRKNNPLDVRVTAAQAFRRMPCDVSRDRVQHLFEDVSEHTELRIASYLTVMQCVRGSHFLRLQRTLAAEANTQVVSFVVSHLRTLKESGEEFQEEAERVLEQVNWTSEQLGRLQLSRHLAGSLWSDHAKVVSNLIWPSNDPSSSSTSTSSSTSSSSTSSWLPRSLSANLTLNLWGQAFDLAEVGVRGEGLEVMMREVLMPMIGLKKHFVGPKKRQEQLSKVKASVYARLLGHDLAFYHFTGTGNAMQQLTSGKFFNLETLVSKIVAEGKAQYSQSLVLADQKATVATSSGFPLTVSLTSSMSSQLQVSGSVDLRQIFAKPRSLHIDGALKPSGALRISASMALDAKVTRASLRMTGSFHTDTIVKGRAHVDRGRMVNIEMDVPRDNMTVFEARTEMTFHIGQKALPLTLTPKEQRDLETCTGPRGVRLTGLDLCGKVVVPKSMARDSVFRDVMSNPSSFSVRLYKRDGLSQYRLFAQHLKTKHSLTTQLTLSTPGSNVDRTLDFGFDANLKQRKIELKMLTPWKKARLAGSIMNTPKKKQADLTLSIDETITHGVTAVVTLTKNQLGVTYIPSLELRHPTTGPVTLSGILHVGRFGREISTELKLTGFLDYSPSFKGSLTNSRKEISLKASVSLDSKTTYSLSVGTLLSTSGRLAGKVETTPFLFLNAPFGQVVSLLGKVDYRQSRSIRADVKLSTGWTRPISLKYALARTPARNQIHYRCDVEFKSSAAFVSIDARADVRQMQTLLTRVTVVHDIPALLPTDTVSMVTKLVRRSQTKYWNGFLQSSLQSKAYPQHNLELKLNGELQPTNSRVKMYYEYGVDPGADGNYVALTSKMRHDVQSLGNVILAVVMTAEIPSENVNVEMKASHSHNIQGLESKVSINYGDDQQTKASFILINKSTDYLMIVGRATLLLPLSPNRLRRGRKRGRKSNKILPDYQLQTKLLESDNDYKVTTGAYAGGRKREFIASMSIQKPVSLRRVQVYCQGNPSSRLYQEFEAEFSHSMHPLLADVLEQVVSRQWSDVDVTKHLRLLTFVKGAKTVVGDMKQAEDSGVYDFTTLTYNTDKVESLYSDLQKIADIEEDETVHPKVDIKGGIDVKSTFIDLVSASYNFAHTYTGSWHTTDIILDNNGDSYAYEMSVRDNAAQWLEHSGGKVVVSTPVKTVTAEWAHAYDGSKIRSTYLTSWSKRRKVLINLSGRLGRSNQTEAFFGDIMLKTPWKALKDLRASVAHDTGPGVLRSKSTFRLNGVVQTSHQVTLVHTITFTDAGMVLVSPWTRRVTGSIVLQHAFYPMTSIMELSWSPRHRVTITGSADTEVWDDAEVSLNIKTTGQTMKRISADMSNKMFGGNLVSVVKVQVGSSNTFSVENVLRRKDFGKMRLRMLSPLDKFRILETGYQLDGSLRNLSAQADFRIYPLVRKIESSLVWSYDQTFSGKFRLDTPLKEFPYLQIVTTSETKGSYQYSTVTLKYHPSKVYALHSKHSLNSFEEIVISIKAPHPSFDKVVIRVHQQKRDRSSDISVNILLPQEQNIVVVGQIKVNRQVHGKFSLRSPFSGFEACEASFVYSFLANELSFAGNVTTEKRAAGSHVVLLSGNNVDLYTDPTESEVISVGKFGQILNIIRSLQKADLGLQTSGASQLQVEKTEDFKLVMLYDQQQSRLVSTFQLDVAKKAMLFSNFTQNSTEAFLAVAAGYHDHLVMSNATISLKQSESAPYHKYSPEKPTQLTRDIMTVEMPDKPQDGTWQSVGGIAFNLEAHAPSLQHDRFGFHTDIQRTDESPNFDEHRYASLPAHRAHISGWAGHSQNSHHAASFNVSEKLGPDQFETNVDITTIFNKTDRVSFQVHSSDMPVGFSGDVQLYMNDKQIFKSFVKNMHNGREIGSTVSWKTHNITNVTLAFLCGSFQDKVTADVSAFYNNTFGLHGQYNDRLEVSGKRKVSVDFGMNSFKTIMIKLSTNITLNGTKPSGDFCVIANSTVWGNHVNMSFAVNEQGYLSVTGRLAHPTSLPKQVSEIHFAYQGVPSNFTSSIFVNHSQHSPVDMRVKVVYVSVFDMETDIFLKSSLPHANDLNVAVKSSGNVQGDRRAVMAVGWAPYKRITVDVRHTVLPTFLGVTRHTDLLIVTPFQRFQNGLVNVRHSKKLTQIDSSVSAKVNGQSVLDVGVFSTDPSALGVQQSMLALFQRNAFVPEKPSHRMNLFLQWNLTNPNSKLHMVTEYKTSDETDKTRAKNLTVTITHPRKTLTVTYLSRQAHDEISGQGELAWDENPTADKKIYYHYFFTNKTTPSASTYQGYGTVGTPFRSLQANGSWTAQTVGNGQSGAGEGHRAHTVHGVMFWDADKDPQKQVVVTTRLTSGDRHSADVTVTIPVVAQTIRVKSDLALQTRDVIWNSTTCLSLSPDVSKVLTFTTALLHSPGPDEGTNYTAIASLTQPSSLLDVGMISHLSRSKSEASCSVGGWFLSTERRMEKVLLRGVFNRLKRSVNITMKTPTRNASITAELTNDPPYELQVTSRVADAESRAKGTQHGLYVSLDPFHRSFLMKVNHDADSPSTYLAAEAWYVNDTAIRAEVYRLLTTGSVTDSALAVRLNTSTLLHLDLSWRPELYRDLQALSDRAVIHLDEYYTQTTQDWTQASRALHDQFSTKWDAVKDQMADDIRPTLGLLLIEWARLRQLTNDTLKNLDDVLKANKALTDLAIQVSEKASEVVRHTYYQLTELSEQWVNRMEQTEIAYLYSDLVYQLPLTWAMAKQRSRERLREVLYHIELYLLLVNSRLQQLSNTVYSLRDWRIDDEDALRKLRSLGQALWTVSERAEAWLAPLSNVTSFITMATSAKELYQQGTWLYYYLDLDSHLEDRLKRIAYNLKDIFLAEIRFHTRHFHFLRKSHVTVWDPKRGKIQMEVRLPVPVQSLWTLPGFSHDWTPSHSMVNKHKRSASRLDGL